MDYNTQREKLVLPEYGRHIQKMIEQVKAIPDKEKRNEQMRAIVHIMGLLNPQLKELNDYKHKLWDHAQIIAGLDIDIDSPYPRPVLEDIDSKPEPIKIEKKPLKAACYGRNIENMINLIAAREDDQAKSDMIKMLAVYMRQQYLIWNKDSVSEETIFQDIEKLSDGKLKVPADIHLSALSADASFSRPGMNMPNNNKGKNNNFKKGKNKKGRTNR